MMKDKGIDLHKNISKNWQKLILYEDNLFVNLKGIQLLHDKQEKSLIPMIRNLNERISKDYLMNEGNIEEKLNQFELVYDDDLSINISVQEIQRYSMIVTVFSFFEGQLKALCNIIQKEFDYKIEASNFNDNDIGRYWKFLKLVFEIEVNKKLRDLQSDIKKIKNTRNIIVHKGGFFHNNQKNDVHIGHGLEIKKELSENKILIKDPSYIKYLVQLLNSFFIELIKACDDRYVVLKSQNMKSN